MNEADKERYFREKEAYERVTGQVLPVSKVVRGNLHLSLSHFVSIFPMSKVVRGNLHLNLSHFVSIFPMSKVVRENLQAFPFFSGGFLLWPCIARCFRGHQVTVMQFYSYP